MASSWIVCPKPNPQARLRLFCFAYAGGGAMIFRDWPKDLLPDLEVCAIQLPGRENRLREAALTRMPLLVRALAQEMLPSLNMPFAFFGHSMGALVGFELARHLRAQYQQLPIHLFFAARRAPQLSEALPQIHNLPEAAFVKELRLRYNGIPEAVLQNSELLQLMLPMLRADFAILETYAYASEYPLDCPITAFGGLGDHMICHDDLAAWRTQTNDRFTLRMLPGDHFFLRDSQGALLEEIRRTAGSPLNQASKSCSV